MGLDPSKCVFDKLTTNEGSAKCHSGRRQESEDGQSHAYPQTPRNDRTPQRDCRPNQLDAVIASASSLGPVDAVGGGVLRDCTLFQELSQVSADVTGGRRA